MLVTAAEPRETYYTTPSFHHALLVIMMGTREFPLCRLDGMKN